MFSVNELTMIYGDRILFGNVNLHFNARRRYGLVGANGAGKTTFLKILKGKLEPTGGKVSIPKDVRIGMLDQDYFRFGTSSILDLVLMGDQKLWQLLKQKEEILRKKSLTDGEIEALGKYEEELSMKGGYRAEAKAAQLLNGLGISPEKHSNPLNTLSGGYKLRVLLAQVLFIQPEILLLDEPTNYLDIFSIRWLERYLVNYPGSLILSSHDRLFLNQVCQEIIDIDYGEMRRYVGDFDHFLEVKKQNVLVKESQLDSLAKRKKEITRFIDRFKAKATKARQASSRERMIEKMEEEEKQHLILPSSRCYPNFHFEITRPSGQQVLVTKEISKKFDHHLVLNRISFEIERGEKVVLVGPNGMGKSTLLEVITDNLEASKGTFRFGVHAHWSYFPQNFHRILNEEITIYDWLSGVSKSVSEQKIRQALGKMLFDEYAIRKKIKALSGGEAARLVFAELMLSNHNILILDEPTNHLDMESVDALIQGLNDYKGTVLMVSHNRYFISKVANRILELTPKGITNFLGGYEEFVLEHERDHLNQSTIKSKRNEKKETQGKEAQENRKRLKREIEKLEKEISQIEDKIHSINAMFEDLSFYEKTSLNEQQVILKERDRLEKQKQSALNLWENKLEEIDELL